VRTRVEAGELDLHSAAPTRYAATAHSLIAKARPADNNEGGDAFTVLWTAE
jgi:hypothetical protein